MKNLTVGELLDVLRTRIKPGGTLPVVKLEGAYYNYDLVIKAINQLETMLLIGQEATPLEAIGIETLLTTIGYER